MLANRLSADERQDRVVQLEFPDGSDRVVDLAPFLWDPIFEEIARDDRVFAQIRVDPEIGTITWPNGADLDPEASPVYFEMRGLLLKTVGPEPLLRQALSDTQGIQEAFIFGSWADPAQLAPADIDLLVIGEPDVGAVYDAVSAVEAEVGRPINVTVRSPLEWENADGAFESSVRSRPRIDLT